MTNALVGDKDQHVAVLRFCNELVAINFTISALMVSWPALSSVPNWPVAHHARLEVIVGGHHAVGSSREWAKQESSHC